MVTHKLSVLILLTAALIQLCVATIDDRWEESTPQQSEWSEQPRHACMCCGKQVKPAAHLGCPTCTCEQKLAQHSITAQHSQSAAFSGVFRSNAAWEAAWSGLYSDPYHPDGYRKITADGGKASVVGKDDATAAVWTLSANVSGSTITVDFSPKGGPASMQGVLVEGSKVRISWPDGNAWTKTTGVNQSRTLHASITNFPNYTQTGYGSTSSLRGVVMVSQPVAQQLMVGWKIEGLQVLGTGQIHIHEGGSCNSPGSHYWIRSRHIDQDPWIHTCNYTATRDSYAYGSYSSEGSTSVLVDLNLTQLVGHTVVLHNPSGVKIGCGVLHNGAPTRMQTPFYLGLLLLLIHTLG